MLTTLITKEVINHLGWKYFDEWDFERAYDYEEGQIYSTADGLLMKCSDGIVLIRYYYGTEDIEEKMDNGWDEESYFDLNDYKDKAYIEAREKFFNMKEICEAAGVSYQSYKDYTGLSSKELSAIVHQMKKVCQ